MITIKHVTFLDGKTGDVSIESEVSQEISARGLTLLPALIDSHVHFRTPGLTHKEDWVHAAEAAIHGGITTVFDMPNTIPPTITCELVKEKQTLIDHQLKQAGIPMHYGLYLGADKNHFDEIARCKGKVVALKIFMGSSTGGLVMDDDASLDTAFRLAAENDLLVAVHAEDEALIHERQKLFQGRTDPKVHSESRNEEVAFRATKKAIELAKRHGARLHILHVGTRSEIEHIRKAKKEGVAVTVETTPHHLFLSMDDYAAWGTKVQMNPPLRTKDDVAAMWEALQDGTLDTIGSDHAPHTLEEKSLGYGKAPSGIPGVETTLPLLLDACNQGRITLEQIVHLMRDNVLRVFQIAPNDDYVLVDMKKRRTIDEHSLKTKCRWSPYAGRTLQGWPVFTILRGSVYEL